MDTMSKFARLQNPYPKPGDVLDGFTLGYVIGRGVCAQVSLMHKDDSTSPATAVLKILRPSMAANHGARRQMLMEAHVLSNLDHDGVPSLISSGTHNALPYLIERYAPGETLLNFSNHGASGPLCDRRVYVVQAMIKVCMTLQAFHARGIIYRDVNPENILVHGTAADPTEQVTLLDFGSCQWISQPIDGYTGVGAMVGTGSLAPREIICGQAAVPASDTYAVCTTLRHLLYGSFPYGNDTDDDATLIKLVRAGGPMNPLPDPSRDGALGLPSGFRELILQGTSPNIQKRFRTAHELITELQRFSY